MVKGSSVPAVPRNVGKGFQPFMAGTEESFTVQATAS